MFTFIQQVISELKKVTWPTREDVTRLTITVLIISVGIGVYLSGLDAIFTNLLKFIL